jgi:hypothetical protein
MTHTLTLSKMLPTAGLRRSLERLADHLIAKLPDSRIALKTSRVMLKITRLIITIEQANMRVKLKADMLASSGWRARVLRDLGGEDRLARWEKSLKRSKERRNIAPKTPTWFEQKRREERAAERRRYANFAPAHPLIFKDKIRVDFEGQFRLAPLPRFSGQCGRRVKTRARREVGALKYWGRDRSDISRRSRPETLNPIALLPRDLRGHSGPRGGGPLPTPLIPAKAGNCAPLIIHRAKVPAFAGMSGCGSTSHGDKNIWARAGP